MKNKEIITAYYDKDNELRIGRFANEKSKKPIEKTTKHIKGEDLMEILNRINEAEQTKPEEQRATVNYTIYRTNNHKKIVSITGVILVLALIAGGVYHREKIFNLFKGKAASKNENGYAIEQPVEATPSPAVATTEEVQAAEQLPEITVVDELKSYTNEEKIKFINENIANFKNDIASATGITLTEEEVLIQLGFINGIRPEQLNIETEDYWLDFAIKYNTILDEMTIPTINYLSLNNKLNGSNLSTGQSVYAKYILDEKDQKLYSFYADNMQNIIKSSFEKDKETVLTESHDFTRAIAETLVYQNNPVQKEEVIKYLEARSTFVNKNNQIPTYEDLANKLNITVNKVRELEVASLGVKTASEEVYFMITALSQKSVQLLPQDTIIEYTDTLGNKITAESPEEDIIMNYSACYGSPQNNNPENYFHSKYLLQDIEYYMGNTIVSLQSKYNNYDENINCSVQSYSKKKTLVRI